jgi:hypothetical protein
VFWGVTLCRCQVFCGCYTVSLSGVLWCYTVSLPGVLGCYTVSLALWLSTFLPHFAISSTDGNTSQQKPNSYSDCMSTETAVEHRAHLQCTDLTECVRLFSHEMPMKNCHNRIRVSKGCTSLLRANRKRKMHFFMILRCCQRIETDFRFTHVCIRRILRDVTSCLGFPVFNVLFPVCPATFVETSIIRLQTSCKTRVTHCWQGADRPPARHR